MGCGASNEKIQEAPRDIIKESKEKPVMMTKDEKKKLRIQKRKEYQELLQGFAFGSPLKEVVELGLWSDNNPEALSVGAPEAKKDTNKDRDEKEISLIVPPVPEDDGGASEQPRLNVQEASAVYTQPPSDTREEIQETLKKFQFEYEPLMESQGAESEGRTAETSPHGTPRDGTPVHRQETQGFENSQNSAKNSQPGSRQQSYKTLRSVKSLRTHASMTGVTPKQVISQRLSIMEKDMDKLVKIVSHRQSIAQTANVPPSDLTGITLSKRQSMSPKKYNSVAKIPAGVLGVPDSPKAQSLPPKKSPRGHGGSPLEGDSSEEEAVGADAYEEGEEEFWGNFNDEGNPIPLGDV